MKANPYFRRTTYISKNDTTNIQNRHFRYRLVGLAKLETSGLDIYLHFFNSCFNRHCNKDTRITQSHISTFFLTFVRLYLLRSLTYRTPNISTKEQIGKIIDEELFKGNQEYDYDFKVKQLHKFTKNMGVEIENEYRDILERGKMNEKDIQNDFPTYSATIGEAIRQLLQKVQRQLKKGIKELINIQFLPELMKEEDQIVRYIMDSFQSISNIQIIRFTLKLNLLRHLTLSHSKLRLKVPYLDQPLCHQKNDITISNLSKEEEPVLISFKDLATHRLNTQLKHEVWDKMAQNAIICCLQHQMQSGHVSPDLTAEDIYLDQRGLNVNMVHDKLILQALGLLHPNTKSMEARLAFAPTPAIREEECYLQSLPQYRLEVNKKYYLKRQQQMKEELKEKIHVWRLIDTLFLLKNGKHLTQFYYHQEYKGKPFSFKTFKDIQESLYSKIEKGQIKVPALIFRNKQLQDNKIKDQFGFGFSDLRTLIGQEDKADSLLDSLHTQRVWSQLQLRKELFQIVMQLLTHEVFFRGLLNPKKYIILLLLSYIQQIHYLSVFFKRPCNNKPTLIEAANIRRKRITDMIAKLQEYQHRNDDTSKYVKQRPQIISQLQRFHSNYQEITRIYQSIEEINQALTQKNKMRPQEVQKLKKKQQQIEEINQALIQKNKIDPQEVQKLKKKQQQYDSLFRKTASDTMNELKRRASSFMNTQIKPLLQPPESLHKKGNQDECWHEYCNYINHKFQVAISVQLKIDSRNWHTYSNLLKSYLLNDTKKSLKRPSKQEMPLMMGKISVLENWLTNQEKSI